MKCSVKLFVVIPFLALLFISCKQQVFTEPQTDSLIYTYGKAFINSNPTGASIYLNGKYTGYVTPDTIKWLSEGNATVTLKKFLFWDTTFTINVDKSTTEKIEIDYYGNPKMYGKIVCTSTPSGAAIYLNNQNTGKITPATLERLLPDSYDVKFDYPEYRKDSLTVTVRSTKETFASVTLEDTLDIVTYNPDNSKFPSYLAKEMVEDKEGNLWIGTLTKGLIKFDGKNFTNYRYEWGKDSSIPADYVTQVKKDRNDNLWFGFSNGLVKYDGTNWEKITTKQVNSIHIAYDNTVLVATDGGGIVRYQNGRYDRLTKSNNGIQSDYIYAVCLDKKGKIWAAPMENGLSVYDGSSWIHLDSANNKLPYNYSCCLALTPEGEVLCMFYKSPAPATEQILARFNGTDWVQIYAGIQMLGLWQVYIDQEYGVWYYLNGIKRLFNNVSKTLTNMISTNLRCFNSINRNKLLNVNNVFIDSEKNLWLLGGLDGLVKIKKGRWSY